MPIAKVRVPLLKVIVHRDKPAPGLSGLCAGFEKGRWRSDALAKQLLRFLPGFCLKHSELEDLDPDDIAELVQRAAKRVYETKKFNRRGEFGELLLYAVLRQVFKTEPAISKIYFKSSANDTVKGFDAVHVVPEKGKLELWLGEVKFYGSISAAIRDVVKELHEHTDWDYLKSEFVAIQHLIDDAWPHAKALRSLLHENTPMEDIIDTICIPVLLTYNSSTITKHTRHTADYIKEITAEFEKYHGQFCTKRLPDTIKIHVFLVPFDTKAKLIIALDRQLKAWQQI
jgi:hypothetical protein